MTERQSALISEARSHVGKVRWRHQGRSWVHGVDCGGFPLLSARDLGWEIEDFPPGYGRYPDGKRFREHLRKVCVEIPRAELQPADLILLLDLIPGIWPCHLAIVANCKERLTIIHSSALEMRVVENGIDANWEAKMAGYFRFKPIAEEVGPWRS